MGLLSLPRRKYLLSETLGFGSGGTMNCLFCCSVRSVQEYKLFCSLVCLSHWTVIFMQVETVLVTVGSLAQCRVRGGTL